MDLLILNISSNVQGPRCCANLYRQGPAKSAICKCGQHQTMSSHTINRCPQTKLKIGLQSASKQMTTHATSWRHMGMTNYRIGPHRTTSNYIELHRTMSANERS